MQCNWGIICGRGSFAVLYIAPLKTVNQSPRARAWHLSSFLVLATAQKVINMWLKFSRSIKFCVKKVKYDAGL